MTLTAKAQHRPAPLTSAFLPCVFLLHPVGSSLARDDSHPHAPAAHSGCGGVSICLDGSNEYVCRISGEPGGSIAGQHLRKYFERGCGSLFLYA